MIDAAAHPRGEEGCVRSDGRGNDDVVTAWGRVSLVAEAFGSGKRQELRLVAGREFQREANVGQRSEHAAIRVGSGSAEHGTEAKIGVGSDQFDRVPQLLR